MKALESKCVKLEDDCRGAVAARDQLRKHVLNLEADNARLEKERLQLVKELEQKKTIVQERDALEVRCSKMKSKLQSILAEDEVSTPAAAPTPVAAPASNPVGG